MVKYTTTSASRLKEIYKTIILRVPNENQIYYNESVDKSVTPH